MWLISVGDVDIIIMLFDLLVFQVINMVLVPEFTCSKPLGGMLPQFVWFGPFRSVCLLGFEFEWLPPQGKVLV